MPGVSGELTKDAKQARSGNYPLSHRADALHYLTRKPLVDYAKGCVIYSGSSCALYLTVAGRVKVADLLSTDRANNPAARK